MHLVRLGLQILEKAFDAKPVLVPLAVPLRRTVDHPVLLLGGELVPRRVARDAGSFGVAHQVVLGLLPGRGLDRLDGAGPQRELVVRDHQAVVNADHAAKAPAGVAGPHRRIEGKHRGNRVGVAQVAVGAVQPGGKLPQLGHALAVGAQHIHRQPPAASLERGLDRLDHAGALSRGQPKAVGHHIQHLARPARAGHLTLGLHPGEAAERQPLRHLVSRGTGRQLHRKGQYHPGLGQGRPERGLPRLQVGVNAVGAVMAHRLRGRPVKQLASPGKQQLEVVVELGHGADRGARRAHRVGLVNRNRRRHAVDPVHRRLVHAVQKLARIGREGFHVAPLAFGVQRVKHQTRFARAAGAGDHRQLAGADVQVQVFQVVLARAANADKTVGHGGVSVQWGRDILGSSTRPCSGLTFRRWRGRRA